MINRRHSALMTLNGWVARLFLAVFMLRALIPVGMMPDAQAAAEGILKVVICTPAGAKTVALGADGQPVQDQGAIHHDQPCAFSGLATVALVAPDAPLLLAPIEVTLQTVPALAVTLPPSRAGPPLGSRGPPLHA